MFLKITFNEGNYYHILIVDKYSIKLIPPYVEKIHSLYIHYVWKSKRKGSVYWNKMYSNKSLLALEN